jgi:hypothetical protein
MRAPNALTLALATSTLAAPTAFAQTGPRMGAAADTSYSARYYSEFAYVLPSALQLDSTEFGDVSTSAAQVSYQAIIPGSKTVSWIAGIDLQGTWFDRPGNAPIPDALYETSLRVGTVWRFADDWTLQVMLSPGLYSDFKDFDGDDFKVPGLILAFWQLNERLQLIGGASVDIRRDLPVIPALGARWNFAEDWTLLAVFPSPRIEYAATDTLTAFVGAELVRTAYRVAEDFGDRFGRPELNDQDMSYNEWRVGVGVRWTPCRAFTVSLDGGWMGERQYNFDDRDFELTSDGAPYVQLGISGTY